MYEAILSKMRWSFSSVSNFRNCKRCFYWTYLDKKPQVSNAFAQWGNFGHHLLEQYFKGNAELFELSDAYLEAYDTNITESFPYNAYADLQKTYFAAGKQFFDHFQGLPPAYEVLEVEKRIEISIGKIPFVGYADLILRNREDNTLLIIDHKSKSKFKNTKEKADFLRQLYLYSIYTKETYGQYPKTLCFNMFRTGKIETETFNQKSLVEATQWFQQTVAEIQTTEDFPDKIEERYAVTGKQLAQFRLNDFFCNELCGVRQHCCRSKRWKGGSSRC